MDTKQSRNGIWGKLPQILRWIGGISLLGSAATFLLGGWMEAEPLVRYYSFFALTSALSLAGVFCGLKLREDKGARTFLSLGTAFIPVLFCQLGAIVYAQFMGTTSQFSEYFQIFEFSPIGIPLLAVTVIIALVSLSFYAFFGFSAMARPMAKKLTGLYLLANAALLIPMRNEIGIAAIGFVLLAILAVIDRKVLSKPTVLRTWEGRAMRSLLFAPFGLLILRNVLLHDASSLLVGLFSASIAMLFFFGLPQATTNASWKRFFQHLSLLPLIVASVSIAFPFVENIRIHGIQEFTTFLVLPFSLLLIVLSRHSKESGRSFRFIGISIALIAGILQMADEGSLAASIISLAVAIGSTLYSYRIREKGLLYLGALGTLISLAFQIRYAVDFYQGNLWLSLAGTGVAVILAASYVERKWKTIIAQGKGMRGKLDDWN